MLTLSREGGSKKLENSVAAVKARLQTEAKRLGLADYFKSIEVFNLSVASAFESDARLRQSLRAVSLADVAIFDVTKNEELQNFEPIVMFLLGVRAVVKRGVSICSVDVPMDDVYHYDLPYNLTYINLSSHHDQHDSGPKILFDKVVSGLTEFRNDPTYEDLPVFHAIRRMGGKSEDFRSIDFGQGPLFLGPFDSDYEESCFKFLEQGIALSLDGVVQEAMGRNYTPEHAPKVFRLLSRRDSKLVARSLYEAIRRYNFCIIDWTLLRPNVFFEFGVRTAVSPLGAVHICAKQLPFSDRLHQMQDFVDRFQPIYYAPDGFDTALASAKEILERRRDPAALERYRSYYYEIASAARPESDQPVERLASELKQLADLTFINDEDSRQVTALHSELNLNIQDDAILRAIGYSLCSEFIHLYTKDNAAQKTVRNLSDVLSFIRMLEREQGLTDQVRVLKKAALMLSEAAARS